jgi:hypothetical protein
MRRHIVVVTTRPAPASIVRAAFTSEFCHHLLIQRVASEVAHVDGRAAHPDLSEGVAVVLVGIVVEAVSSNVGGVEAVHSNVGGVEAVADYCLMLAPPKGGIEEDTYLDRRRCLRGTRPGREGNGKERTWCTIQLRIRRLTSEWS